MSAWERAVSADAWDSLVAEYEDFGGEDANDHTLAEMLRRKVAEVEG